MDIEMKRRACQLLVSGALGISTTLAFAQTAASTDVSTTATNVPAASTTTTTGTSTATPTTATPTTATPTTATVDQTTVVVNQTAATIDQTASTSPTRVADNMANTFTKLAGTKADALKLIEALHDGKPLVAGSGTQPTAGTGTRPMGYGNVFVTLALAQATLAKAGITAPTAEQLNAVLVGGSTTSDGKAANSTGILTLRASGMGWGQIAKQQGLNLGQVVGAIKSGHERLEKSIKAPAPLDRSATSAAERQAPRSEKAERSEKVERPEKVARPEKIDRPEKVERPERPERPEKVERPERVERPEKIDRPEKVERSGRV